MLSRFRTNRTLVGDSGDPTGAEKVRAEDKTGRIVPARRGLAGTVGHRRRGGVRCFPVHGPAFVGERLVVVPNDPEDTGSAGVFLFHLGAKRPVQEIDFHQKGAGGDTRFLGVCEVQGQTLRLCISSQVGTRAISLEPGTRQTLLVARRVHWNAKGVDNDTPRDKLTR